MKKTVFIIFSLLFSSSANYSQTWEFVGLDSMVVKQLYVSGDTIYAGTAVRSGANINSGLYFTSDGGTNWIQLDSALGSGSCVWMKYIGDGELFLIKGLSEGSLAGKVYRTTNNGLSWNIINISSISTKWIDSSPFNKNEVYALTYYPSPAGIFNGLHKSTDGGNTWTSYSGFPSSNHGSRLTFAFDMIDSTSLFVTVDTGFDLHLYKSTNKGFSWFRISTPPASPAETRTDLFLPGRLYLFTEYKASDNDEFNWYDFDSGLPNHQNYLSFYMNANHPNKLFNLRRDGLYVAKNDTIYWQLIEGTDELPLNIGSAGFSSGDVGNLINIFIDESINSLYLGTASGIFKKEFVTSINTEIDRNPTKFILHQNYPNPFNPITTISYRVPETNFITIKVYDVLGKEVAILVNEEKPSGSYEINFDAGYLASGVYIYHIIASKSGRVLFTNSKQMILLR